MQLFSADITIFKKKIAPENMKKPTSKMLIISHNFFQYCKLAQNQPKSCSPHDLFTVWAVNDGLSGNLLVSESFFFQIFVLIKKSGNLSGGLQRFPDNQKYSKAIAPLAPAPRFLRSWYVPADQIFFSFSEARLNEANFAFNGFSYFFYDQ